MKLGRKPVLNLRKKLLIRFYRRKHSYRVVAEKLGVSDTTVSNYINGKYQQKKRG